MANASTHCVAKRGSPRYKAQCNVLERYFACLCSEVEAERNLSLNGFRNLRKTILYLKRVTIKGRSMLLLEQLLQCAKTFTVETHDSTEIRCMTVQLRWIEKQLTTRTAQQRRLLGRLHIECHRLDVQFVLRLRLENAWEIESKWKQQLADQQYAELAEDILWAAGEGVNRYVRIAAFRWIAEQRRLLPLNILNCRTLLGVLRAIPVKFRTVDERVWSSSALVVTLDFEKIYSPAPLWLESNAIYQELIAGEEMRTGKCEKARTFFTV